LTDQEWEQIASAYKNGSGSVPADFNILTMWRDHFGGQTYRKFMGLTGDRNPYWVIGRLTDMSQAQAEGETRRQKEQESKNKKW
jgi:hypothetical protein